MSWQDDPIIGTAVADWHDDPIIHTDIGGGAVVPPTSQQPPAELPPIDDSAFVDPYGNQIQNDFRQMDPRSAPLDPHSMEQAMPAASMRNEATFALAGAAQNRPVPFDTEQYQRTIIGLEEREAAFPQAERAELQTVLANLPDDDEGRSFAQVIRSPRFQELWQKHQNYKFSGSDEIDQLLQQKSGAGAAQNYTPGEKTARATLATLGGLAETGAGGIEGGKSLRGERPPEAEDLMGFTTTAPRGPADRLQETLRHYAEQKRQRYAPVEGETPYRIAGGVAQGLLPLLAGGLGSGAVAAGFGLMGGASATEEAYQDLKRKGMSDAQASQQAAIEGVILGAVDAAIAKIALPGIGRVRGNLRQALYRASKQALEGAGPNVGAAAVQSVIHQAVPFAMRKQEPNATAVLQDVLTTTLMHPLFAAGQFIGQSARISPGARPRTIEGRQGFRERRASLKDDLQQIRAQEQQKLSHDRSPEAVREANVRDAASLRELDGATSAESQPGTEAIRAEQQQPVAPDVAETTQGPRQTYRTPEDATTAPEAGPSGEGTPPPRDNLFETTERQPSSQESIAEPPTLKEHQAAKNDPVAIAERGLAKLQTQWASLTEKMQQGNKLAANQRVKLADVIARKKAEVNRLKGIVIEQPELPARGHGESSEEAAEQVPPAPDAENVQRDRAARPVPRAKLEQELIDLNPIDIRGEIESRTEAEIGGNPFAFRDEIPAEAKRLIEGQPAHVQNSVRVVHPGEDGYQNAMGNDALSEWGEDIWFDRLKGGHRQEVLETSMREARKGAYGPRGQLLAHILDNAGPERPTQKMTDVSEVPAWREFTSEGVKFQVIEDAEGIRVLKDGEDLPLIPIEDAGKIPVDKGSMREMPEPEVPATFEVPNEQVSQRNIKVEQADDASSTEMGGNAPKPRRQEGAAVQEQAETSGRAGEPPEAQPAEIAGELASPSGDEPLAAPARPSSKVQYPKPGVTGTGRVRVTSQQIHDKIETILRNVMRVGSGDFARKRASGWFQPKGGHSRVKSFGNLGTKVHELGHSIYRKDMQSSPMPLAVRREMTAVGKQLYGSRKPNAGYAEEGFSEYIARRLLGEDMTKSTPATDKWFESHPFSPEFRKHFAELAGMAQEWDAQGAIGRVKAQISDLEPKTILERAKATFARLGDVLSSEKHITDAAPLNKAVAEMAEDAGVSVDSFVGSMNPAKVYDALKMNASGTAREFITKTALNPDGSVASKSLKDILADATGGDRGKLSDFIAYAYARKAEYEWTKGGGKAADPGISLDDARIVIDAFESPAFKQGSDDLTRINDLALEYLVNVGGLSQKAREAMRRRNEIYIPLKRFFDDSYAKLSGRGGGGTQTAPSPIKGRKGSGRAIRNPIHAIIEQMEKLFSAANSIEVTRSVVKLAESQTNGGWLAHEVTIQDKVLKTTVEAIQSDLKKAGADLSNADMDAQVTMFMKGREYFGPDNIVPLWKNGDLKFYWIDPDVYRVLTNLDKNYLPAAMSFLAPPARLFRTLTTGVRAGFALVSNPIKDALSAGVYGKYKKSPLATWDGLWDMWRGGESSRLFRALGGSMSTIMGQDRWAAAAKTADELILLNRKERLTSAIRHPLDTVRAAFEFMESAPRVGEFKAAMKDGLKRGLSVRDAQIEAMLAAKDVTVNFTRMGTFAGIYNQIAPFYNARIQGINKFYRTFATSKGEAMNATMAAVSKLTIPALLAWFMVKDEEWYKELPDYERYNYMHFGKRWKIPIPHELGKVFMTAPVAVADKLYQKDPRSAGGTFFDALVSFMPFENLGDVLPVAISPSLEASANYDFFRGRPIVDPFQAERKLPKDQYEKWTTETAKTLGAWLNVSPKKIEHVLGGYTGGAGVDALKYAELVAGIRKPDQRDAPIISRIRAADPTGRGYSMNLFRDELKLLRQKKGSKAATAAESLRASKLEYAKRQIDDIDDSVEAKKMDYEAGQKRKQTVLDSVMKPAK